MRLNKYLAKSGVASRRKSDELIQMATTEVNGKICLDPAYDVRPGDKIFFDGRRLTPSNEKIVYMLNKPEKVITTVSDTHGRRTVMDYVKSKLRLSPVGRLDKQTKGLLLLTNDGDLHHYLTHPSNRVPKDYEAIIEGRVDPVNIRKLSRGIYIGDKEYGRAEMLGQETEKGRSKVKLRLRQGKKREIRRIFFRLKIKLLSLKRIGYSNLKLGNLSEGEYRQLTAKEIKSLYDQ
ncbi:MAG: pseudouridine synthase [Candidatus Marinimicrobia bacterium]|nr:pseudouridine synthase [Candidatus Neomarinimicrobiota bacterium]